MMPKPVTYVSTRDSARQPVSLEDALLMGLAPDGGLFVPTRIPWIDVDSLPQDNFMELAGRVLTPWLEGTFTETEVHEICREAFNFPVPVVPLSGRESVSVLELFHGPTLSFKDFGARFLGRVLGRIVRDEITILVATSGDTGSAVADGCSGIPGVRVVLLFPAGQVSTVQEQQLIAKRPGVSALRINGSFDDCQQMVKRAFSDRRLESKRLSTANSINIGRLLPQMLYYIHAAKQVGRTDITFCVPSGNLGNLTAGVLAHQSGLGVKGFVAAHNLNDFFPRWLANPESAFSPSRSTLSNAMDVGAPSNFERLLYLLEMDELRHLIQAVSISDEQTTGRMKQVWETYGYQADPHTGVGLDACFERSETASQMIVLATAHPGKFPDTVLSATGRNAEVPSQLASLDGAACNVLDMEADLDRLVEFLRM